MSAEAKLARKAQNVTRVTKQRGLSTSDIKCPDHTLYLEGIEVCSTPACASEITPKPKLYDGTKNPESAD